MFFEKIVLPPVRTRLTLALALLLLSVASVMAAAPSQSCTDTDGGIVLGTRGTCTPAFGTGGTDVCSSSSSVLEYYCQSTGACASGNFACPSGLECLNGACVDARASPIRCGLLNASLVLAQDVSSAGTCFSVQSNNLVIDCAGHVVSYANAGISQPSLLNGAANGVYSNGFSNLTVKNCVFVEGNSSARNSSAMVFANSPNSKAANNTVRGNSSVKGVFSHAIVLYNSSNAVVNGNRVTTSGSGSHALLVQPGSTNASVLGNNFSTNSTLSSAIALDGPSLAVLSGNSLATYGDLSPAIYLTGVSDRNLAANNSIATYGQDSDGVLLYAVSPPRTLYGASSWSSLGTTLFNSSTVNDGVGCESTENGLPCQQAVVLDGSGAGSWIMLDTGAATPKEFLRVRIQSRAVYSAVWDVQYSDDASTWQVAYSGWNSGAAVDSSVDLPSAGPHRYWRLFKTSAPSAVAPIGEIQFFESASAAVTLISNSITVSSGNSRGIYAFASTGVSIDSSTVLGRASPFTGILLARSSKLSISNTVVTSSIASADAIGLSAGSYDTLLGSALPVSGLKIDSSSFSGRHGGIVFSHLGNFSNTVFSGSGSPQSIGLQLNYSSNNSFTPGRFYSSSGAAGWLYNSPFNYFRQVTLNGNFTLLQGSRQDRFVDPLEAGAASFVFQGSDESMDLYWSVRAKASDAAGNPVTGSGVNVSNPAGTLYSLSTDSSGFTPFVSLLDFSGNNPALTSNPFNFTAKRQGYLAASISQPVSSAFGTVSLTLISSAVPRPASLQGSVLSAIPSQNSIVEFNSTGSKVWGFDGGVSPLSSPHDAVGLSNGSVLVSDTGNHRVAEFSSSGQLLWQYGITGVAGSSFNQLSSPSTCVRTSEGTTLIADTFNDRVIEVDSSGALVWSLSTAKPLFAIKQGDRVLTGTNGTVKEFNYTTKAQVWSFPVVGSPKAYFLSTGNVLLVDSPNSVSEVARVLPSSGTLIWSKPVPGIADAFENPGGKISLVAGANASLLSVDRQALSPRVQLGGAASSIKPSVGPLLQPTRQAGRSGLSYFVADTGSKRVVELDEKLENVLWVFSSNLDSPKGVASAYNGERLFIADAGLRKVVGITYPNATIFFQKSYAGTPVDVKWVSGELILVTDAASNLVEEINFSSGAVTWSFGSGVLSSPSGAFPLSDGSVLVSDTGNNRVLKVSRNLQFVEVKPNGQSFSQPSRAMQKPNGNIVVADTGKRRVIEFDSSGTVVREFTTGFSAPVSAASLPDERLLVSDVGLNSVQLVSSASTLGNYAQLNSPGDAVLAFDPSFYYSVYSTLLAQAEAGAFSTRLSQSFSFILARGSIGSVEAIGVDNSLWQPFWQVGGLQVSSCQPGDLQCCTRSWCSQAALLDLTVSAREKAFAVANSTAFRRGGNQPYSSFAPLTPFVFSVVAQLAQGTDLSNLSSLRWSCSKCAGPGIFVLRASTFNASNSSSWAYSAEPLNLTVNHAIDGGQASQVELLGFAYSNGASVQVSAQPNLLSANQLEKQAVITSSCTWPRVSCAAVRGACCRTDASGSCTAFTYSFSPAIGSTISPVGSGCGNLTASVQCTPASFCGETDAVPLCSVIAPSTFYQITNGAVARSSQDGLSSSCAPVPAPLPPSFSADGLARQLSQFVKPPVCVTGASGSCPAVAMNAQNTPGIISSIRISSQ